MTVVAVSRKKPRKQKIPKNGYDGQSKQYPVGADDGISRLRRRREVNNARVRDWSRLPDGLVAAISKRLPVVSAISMGLACKSWRRVLSETTPLSHAPSLPWFIRVREEKTVCYSLVEEKSREVDIPEAWKRNCWGSIQDWLIVGHKDSGLLLELELSFCNPFSNTKLMSLPKVINEYYKIVVSASPADEKCIYLLLHKSLRDIAYWSRGVSTWCKQQLTSSEEFDDAVFCDGRFYFVTRDFKICTLDPNNMISAKKGCVDLQCRYHQVEMPCESMHTCSRRHLVESCGEVWLVLRCFAPTTNDIRPTLTFRVFKLDTRRLIWIWTRMNSLGDRVLFLGNSDTRLISAKEVVPDESADSILFFRDSVFPGDGDNEWTREKYKSGRPFRFGDWGTFMMKGDSFAIRLDARIYPSTWPPLWISAPIWWYLTGNNPQIR